MSLKRLVRGFAHEGYHRIKLRFELWNVEARNPILVYQMGKVGSSTVVNTLHQLGLPEPVLHVHTLSRQHLAYAKSRQRQSSDPFLREHMIVSTYLRKKLDRATFPCRIITLTREPVSRAISFVFEDLKKQVAHAYFPDGRLDTDAIKATLNDLLSVPGGVADPTTWFDRELYACFGIDVFSRPYDVERGYTIFSNEKASVLVIRMEDIDRALEAALADFLNIDPAHIMISQVNVGAGKWYADALACVKETYRIAPGVAGVVFSTKYFQHFYTANARKIHERWGYADQPFVPDS